MNTDQWGGVPSALLISQAVRLIWPGLSGKCGPAVRRKWLFAPFEKGTLFLFCGKRSDRCKGLLWMGTGFLLLYKRFENGRMSWPRNTQEAADLTEEQFHYLMMGLNPLDLRVKEVAPEKIY
ncbi:IS66 family insertion sequence element accessory protein TnpB [Lachnoclostridium sp. An76]|uniref:IS66 family insertion sequence element accessory protein TnpB n=1 Tax=Lachnoclostridium sp. An76 TaxID=1965654 RepID=UPI00117ADF06|nr:IS66 family insertion sequence element accessory protein TnpB [Lachnoclostridium sp. An76]